MTVGLLVTNQRPGYPWSGVSIDFTPEAGSEAAG